MTYRLLADFVVLLHFGFVAFVTLGGLLGFRWRRAPMVHLPAALWGIWIEVSGGICPLTPLENWLRAHGGGVGYSGGFVEHYILPVLYPAGLTRETQYLLAGLVVAVNLVVYVALWRRRSEARG
ncbi:MAG: DUF2784 domain-containing protein [Gemmatimonadota bacterium]|nr:DUF2784 domain-containing protein [Gemmatimonadota bacterium]MDH4347832.1 DUF2784 domain-containing protein [Gemmatimonadota bacterium]MDH5284525.1 DUF2784 domain-containing protein [Gemmatimonadota bacterium]